MKAFCIAFHKSGTSSQHAWFAAAGFTSLHYPKHVGRVNYAHAIRPVIGDNERILDALAPLIETHDAHSDAPWPGLWRELARRYPHARFVLIEREPDQWWESLAKDWQLDLVGRYMATFEWVQYRNTLMLDPRTLITRKHRDLFIAAYRRHAAEVKQALPPHRLCALRLTERDNGEKLSGFFGLDETVPFPHRLPASASRPWKKTFRTLRRRLFGSDLTGGF